MWFGSALFDEGPARRPAADRNAEATPAAAPLGEADGAGAAFGGADARDEGADLLDARDRVLRGPDAAAERPAGRGAAEPGAPRGNGEAGPVAGADGVGGATARAGWAEADPRHVAVTLVTGLHTRRLPWPVQIGAEDRALGGRAGRPVSDEQRQHDGAGQAEQEPPPLRPGSLGVPPDIQPMAVHVLLLFSPTSCSVRTNARSIGASDMSFAPDV